MGKTMIKNGWIYELNPEGTQYEPLRKAHPEMTESFIEKGFVYELNPETKQYEPVREASNLDKVAEGLKTYGEIQDTYGGGAAVREPIFQGLKAAGLSIPKTRFKTGRIAQPSFIDVLKENYAEPDDGILKSSAINVGGLAADILTDPTTYLGGAGLFGRLLKAGGRGAKALTAGTKVGSAAAKAAAITKQAPLFSKLAPYAPTLDQALDPLGSVVGKGLEKGSKAAFEYGYAPVLDALRRKSPNAKQFTDVLLDQGYAGQPIQGYLTNLRKKLYDERNAALESAPDWARVEPSSAKSAIANAAAEKRQSYQSPYVNEQIAAAQEKASNIVAGDDVRAAYNKQVAANQAAIRKNKEIAKAKAEWEKAQAKKLNQGLTPEDLMAGGKAPDFTPVPVPALPEVPIFGISPKEMAQRHRDVENDFITEANRNASSSAITSMDKQFLMAGMEAQKKELASTLDKAGRLKKQALLEEAANTKDPVLKQQLLDEAEQVVQKVGGEFRKIQRDLSPLLAEKQKDLVRRSDRGDIGANLAATSRLGPVRGLVKPATDIAMQNVAPLVYQIAKEPAARALWRRLITTPLAEDIYQGE